MLYTKPWKPSKDHFHFITHVPFKHDDKTNVDYFLHYEDDTIYAIFEPTTDKKDWKSDFTFFPKRFDIFPGSKIKVHSGIAKQYLGMRSEFLDMIYRNNKKCTKIYLSGFSLGGGLTQLACEDVTYHFPDKEILAISYEGPRVFTPHKMVKKLCTKDRLTLVKTFWDPVVHVPFVIMGFVDYGKKIWIGKWNRIAPIQHDPDEIEDNLFEKFSE